MTFFAAAGIVYRMESTRANDKAENKMEMQILREEAVKDKADTKNSMLFMFLFTSAIAIVAVVAPILTKS